MSPFTKPGWYSSANFFYSDRFITIPATPTGTYTARCCVNGQGYAPPELRKPSQIMVQIVTPQILIDKRDANPPIRWNHRGNDSQTVSTGNAAVFKNWVTNTGTEDLKNIVLWFYSSKLWRECHTPLLFQAHGVASWWAVLEIIQIRCFNQMNILNTHVIRAIQRQTIPIQPVSMLKEIYQIFL